MRDDFKNQLFLILQNRLRVNSYSMSSILESDVKELIDNSVNKISFSDYDSDIKRTEARINTLILADAIIADGKIRGFDKSTDFKSLSNARNSICPLWPFC